jgi:hypothetical protein
MFMCGQRKRCPVHHLDWHQARCPHDGGCAELRGRRSNKKISAVHQGRSRGVHRHGGATSFARPQRFYVICKRPKLGRAALTATVAAPELVQRRRQHDGMRSAGAIRHPCAVVVACWPGIEAKLTRQLDDRGLMASLRSCRRQCVALQLLGDCSDDVSQFGNCEQARQIWRPWELMVNPCTHERVQKPRRRFTLRALARGASDTAASYFGLDPGGIAALAGVQVLPGSFLGMSG